MTQIRTNQSWVDTERYDVSAEETSRNVTDSHGMSGREWAASVDENYQRLRTLLAERFHLVAHEETISVPVYVLTVARENMIHHAPCADTYHLGHGLAKGQMKLSSLAAQLSHDLDQVVVDETNVEGCVSLDAKWTQDPDNTELPSIATTLHEAGLEMKTRKGKGSALVIDHIEKPSAN